MIVVSTLSMCLAALAQGGEPPPERMPVEPMPIPVGMARALGGQKIQVDGALEDWPATSPVLLLDTRQLSGTAMQAYRGASDLAAQLFFAWDDQDLYVAAKVRDDWHRPLGARTYGVGEVPPADSVLLTFDPKRDTRSLGRDLGREDDREFWLAQVDGEGAERVVLWDRFRGTARWSDGGRLVIARDDKAGVTTYEARLPWSEVLPPGMHPAPNLPLDMQMVVNDFDEVTDVMAQTRLGWTFGTGPRIDPGVFGTLFLMTPVEGAELRLPEVPPRTRLADDPVPGPRYWVEFYERLRKGPPQVFDPEHGDPRNALTEARRGALTSLDAHLAGFPRVDFLEFQHRIHRRMRREAAGVVATGLPYFWDHVLADVRRRLDAPAPEHGFRLFRLPQDGWVVVSKEATFAIDPAGYGLEQLLFEKLDFVLLTDPLDACKRNDQLLLRMLATGRAFVTHIGFHLPAVDVSKLALAEPGREYEQEGLRVAVLGDRDGEGKVTTSIGYVVRWPDGTTLGHTGLFARADHVPPDLRQIDAMILSAEHATPLVAGQRIAAKLTVLDDVLQCARRAGSEGRVSLDGAFELQATLRPHRSVILAPGEALDIHR